MDFAFPHEAEALLDEVDTFVDAELKPLEDQYAEFFDHRREDSRTDWADGTPTDEWVALLEEMRTRSDEAGFYRMRLPSELGGVDEDALTLTIIQEHLARKGPGLHNVVHTGVGWETIIGDWRHLFALYEHGSVEQKVQLLDDMLERNISMAFGMTEPGHGSDPAYMDSVAEKDGDEWIINGRKRFIGGMHNAAFVRLFARTSGQNGSPEGITTFLVPTDAEGLDIEYFHWGMNMPSTQAELEITDIHVPENAVLGDVGDGLIQQGREFLIDGWLGQATMALGTAQFCIDETVGYANERTTFGEPLSKRQAIQFPVADIHTETELVRNLIYKVAWLLDDGADLDKITELVSMANYRATNLACRATDQAIQVHGGKGWTRHYPFEYLYRQFRRYRITEGAEEIQRRRVGGYLFGYI